MYKSLMLSSLLTLSPAQAVETNITPTKGQGNLNTQVTINMNNYAIHGGEQHGANLFHSFQDFNIGAGDTGQFINNSSSTVNNILSRVTGGNISEINGRIDTQAFPNANFYFINPAGVIFGANATLNINGSFHTSTANYISLGDTTNAIRFYADPARQTALLTSAAPSAFGFFQQSPAQISVNESALEVKQGQTISLSAGNITIQGANLLAPEGKIALTGIAKTGDLQLTTNTNQVEIFGGNISLSNNTHLNTSGESGGHIVIRGGNLLMEGSSMIADTLGEKHGIGIDIALSGKLEVNNKSSINANASGSGNSGNINIRASELLLQGGQVSAFVFSEGHGGGINVEAEKITLVRDSEDNGSRISAIAISGSGNAGDITLKVGTLSVSDNNLVGSLSFDTTTGSAGDIRVEADEIYLTQGGRLIADSKSNGEGGNLSISASRRISLQGVHYIREGTDFIGSGFFSDSEGKGEGNGGNIFISTPELLMQGGKIGASVNVSGKGEGGVISIHTDYLSIGEDVDGNPSQITVTTKGSGNAGTISLDVDTLLLDGQSVIGAFSRGAATGDAGQINIQAEQIILSAGGHINSTSLGLGNGGDINIIAEKSITLKGASENSSSSTTASGVYSDNKKAGNGGRISITTPKLLIEGGEISASSAGNGLGGEISISTDQLIMRADDTSQRPRITVVSKGMSGIGNINIQALNIELSDSSISAANRSVLDSGDQQNNVNTQDFKRNGGNIKLFASESIYLTDSNITTQVSVGNGEGGNVKMDSKFIIMNSSQVIADAARGNGGNIKIIADAFFQSPDNVLSASSELGVDGEILIESPITDIISSIQLLAADFLDVNSIISTPCAQRLTNNTSSLVMRKYDVLPDSPYALRTFNAAGRRLEAQNNISQLADEVC